jgi:hypothetical protein
VTAETWADGYAAGDHRGRHDGAAENTDTYRRDHSHDGENADRGTDWVDGFLTGYAAGRNTTLRGGK